jgi:hypothetical protein
MLNFKHVPRQTHNPHSTVLPLTAPFTPHTLACIKSRLSHAVLNHRDSDTPWSLGHLAKFGGADPLVGTLGNKKQDSEPNAAVLIPFCNVDGVPGILLEVRGKLRTHSGEVRCVVDAGHSTLI